nr:MAG TPA: hypothetical protein [Caudoviricetes sp.]
MYNFKIGLLTLELFSILSIYSLSHLNNNAP